MSEKIIIEDVYVEDIVKEMAVGMNTTYVEEQNITKFKIPETFGDGFINATQFASGIGIIDATYQLKDDLIFELEKNKINPLKFIFNLGDTIFHKHDNEDDFKEIAKYHAAIIGSSVTDTHSFKIPSDKSVHLFSLELNRNLFEHKLEGFKFDLDDELNTLLRDVKAQNPFFYSYPFDFENYDMINKILYTSKKGFIGSLYKEGVSYTILSKTLEEYLGENCEICNDKLSEIEIDLVLNVSKYIENNLSLLPTIEEIATKNFTSETKLQKLFKNYYNCSVHDFIRNKRLEQARIMLENTKLTISDIADDLGIRSKSYFSKIFKERYGVTPSEYRGSRLAKIRIY